VPDEIVDINGVTVVGLGNLPNYVCRDASVMYANNLFNLVEDTWNKETSEFELDMENDILPGCVITHDGGIVNETIKNILAGDD
jgi:NAD(P) transhydrogenase subunit alpha